MTLSMKVSADCIWWMWRNENEKRKYGFYDNSFDVIRLFAAVQVFIGHYLLWYQLSLGTFGDRLFTAFQGVPVLFAGGGPNSSIFGKK